MDKDIKDKLIDDAKKNMTDLWDNIEYKLQDKKKSNKKKIISIVAALACVIAIGGIGNRFIDKSSQDNILEDPLDNSEKFKMLPDLNLESYLMNKISLGGIGESSYRNDEIFINYDKEADNVIYGKVTEVSSYVNFGVMIFSDIKIEVIEDCKGNINEGENIVLGDHGGELTYDEFILQAYDELVDKRGYSKILDKSKIFVELTDDNIPQYRVGEYVLVYVEQADKDSLYNQSKDLVKTPITYNYVPLKKLYVNPNTEEVFEYTVDSENNELIKQKVDTLESIESSYK